MTSGLFIAVTAATALSKAMGFLRSVVLAKYLGAAASLDAFFAVLTVAGFFCLIIGDQIEIFAIKHVKTARSPAAAAELVLFSFVVGVGTTGAMLLLFKPCMALFMPTFSPEQTRLAWKLLLLLAPMTLLYSPASALTGILKATSRFKQALAIDTAQSGLFFVLTWLSLRTGVSRPMYALAASQTGAFLLCFLVILWAGRPVLSQMLSIRRIDLAMVRESSELLIFEAAMYLLTFIDRHYAALAAAGGVAILTYASNLSFAMRSAINYEQVFLLGFSDSVDRPEKLRRAIGVCLLVAIPGGVYMTMFAQPLVAIVYQRGAFGSLQMEATAGVLVAYGVATVPFLVWAVLFRMLQALDGIRWATLALIPAAVVDALVARALLPRLGAAAAVWGTLAAHLLLIATVARMIYRMNMLKARWSDLGYAAGWTAASVAVAEAVLAFYRAVPTRLGFLVSSSVYFVSILLAIGLYKALSSRSAGDGRDIELHSYLCVTRRLPRVRGVGVLSELLRRFYLRRKRGSVEIDVKGLRMRLDPGECVDGGLLFHPQLYEPREIDFVVGRLSPGETFVDLGSNIGFYTLQAAKAVGPQGRVIAVDADAWAFERLCENLKKNADLNVTPVHSGLSDRDELLRLSLDMNGNRGGTSFVRSSAEGVEVRCRTLLDILTAQRVERIAGLKADIEGFELKVLSAYFESAPTQMRPGFLLIEENPEFVREGEMERLLERFGYECAFRTRLNAAYTLRRE